VFYSQTPESCLEDLGGIKGSFSKGAGAKHLRILKGDVILNGVKNRRNERIGLTQQFFEQSSQNDISCYPRPLWERVPKAGEGLREEEIFRPSAEIVSTISTTNAQNDIRVNEAPEQSYLSEARVSSRLEKGTEINKKLDSRTQGFENDVLDYPRSVGERVPKAGEGLREKEILRPSAEVVSTISTTNAQNDRIIPLSEGRGRNCANGSERTISGEGLVKESQNQVDMLALAILRRCTPQNDNLKSPLPPFNKGGKTASLVREESRSDGGFENTLCHSERSEESQSLANIVSKKILKQVQDDVYGCHSEAKAEESQSLMQRMVCPLPLTPSTLRFAPVYKLAKLVPRLLLLHPAGRGVKKPAFTLAEILVTLGVIGIIAAMTLPMLARNYQFYIRQQQFKKAYAALNIAVQKTQIDMGEGVRCFYKSSGSGQYISDCKWFYSELSKQLNLIKVCEGNALDKGCISRDMRGGEEIYVEVQGGNDPAGAEKFYNQNCLGFKASYIKNKNIAYVLNPGFMIMAYNADNNPIFLLDINALRGPNKWGHDVFLLRFIKIKNSDSVFTIKPVPGHSCHSLDKGGYYTETFMKYLYGQNAEL